MRKIVGVTGHRPNKLGGYSDEVANRLMEFAMSELLALEPDGVITGMAIGWDTAIARASVELGIPFVAAVPFEGQEGRWPEASKKLYYKLLEKAYRVVNTGGQGYSTAKMYERNKYIVDKSGILLALHDGTSGGTAHTVSYARQKSCPIVNCYSRWKSF